MFKLLLNNKLWKVRFLHNLKPEKGKRRYTVCQIRVCTPEDDRIIYNSVVKVECSDEDVFNRATGRKLALTKVINEYKKQSLITREEARALWKEYFNNTKEGALIKEKV